MGPAHKNTENWNMEEMEFMAFKQLKEKKIKCSVACNVIKAPFLWYSLIRSSATYFFLSLLPFITENLPQTWFYST